MFIVRGTGDFASDAKIFASRQDELQFTFLRERNQFQAFHVISSAHN